MQITGNREAAGCHFTDYLSMKSLPLTQAAVRVSSAFPLTLANIEHAPNDGIWFDPIDDLVISVVLHSDRSRVVRDVGKGRSELRYKPGTILVTPASKPSYWRFDGKPQVLHLSLPYRSALDLVAPHAPDPEDAISRAAHAPLNDPLMAEAAKRIWITEVGGCRHPQIIERALGLIMDLIVSPQESRREAAPQRAPLSQWQLNRVIHIMSERKLRVSVRELAASLDMSADHFIRSFKAATGLSPGKMVRNLCMQEAMALLLSRRLTMTEIAMDLGFSSSSHFSTFFRSQTGVPPSRWLAVSREEPVTGGRARISTVPGASECP